MDKLAKKQEKLVSKEEGERMAESVKAAKYLECSALTREGVENVFDEAILQILQHLEESKNGRNQRERNAMCYDPQFRFSPNTNNIQIQWCIV